MSNEENTGCLGYIGDEILPSYMRDYFINHSKDPYQNASIMERTCGVQWAQTSPTFFSPCQDDDRELARALELSRMEERHRNMAPVEVHICHRGLSPWPVIVANESVGKGNDPTYSSFSQKLIAQSGGACLSIEKNPAYLKPSKDLYIPQQIQGFYNGPLPKLP